MASSKKIPKEIILVNNNNYNIIYYLIFFVLIMIIGYLLFLTKTQNSEIKVNNDPKIVIKENQTERTPSYGYNYGFGLFSRPNYAYSNIPGDVLLNPYVPPLRDERYLIPQITYGPPGTIPINISTNIGAVDTSYRQLGLLTPLNQNSNGKILPLMGRPLFVNRDKWQYYTLSDQNNSIKLPVVRAGRSCTNEYGCDILYSGDSIYVEGYKEAFRVTMYDNDTIKYLPFI
jgi:hypothetical protein